MKKRYSDNHWIPLWVDKWLFGSTRIELSPEERGVWIDLIALASKDDGYIRANQGCPYPLEQLAGMLIVPKEVLEKTINKCLEPNVGKLEKLPDGTLKIKSWEKYELSKRHKRRIIFKSMSEKADHMSENEDAKRREEKIREEKKREDNNTLALNDADASNSELVKKPVIPKINFSIETRSWENITDEDVSIWEKAYPAVDITQELSKMADWLISNPEKKKKNYRRFITNWLSRAQERGGSKGNKQIIASRVGEQKEKTKYPEGYWEKVRELRAAGLTGGALTNELKKFFPNFFQGGKNA